MVMTSTLDLNLEPHPVHTASRKLNVKLIVGSQC